LVKIAVINQKGGTGKTTSTVSLAASLEREFRQKVLVVDCDPSINASKYLMTLDDGIPEDDPDLVTIPSIVQAVNEGMPAAEIIRPVKQVVRGKLIDTNIYILPGHKQVEELCDFESDYVLKEILEPLESEFDFCLFDCPPHITDMCYEAMACTQYIVVPAFADTDSLWGFDILLDLVNNMRTSLINTDLQILGIFFTNVQSQNALNHFYMNDYVENDINDLIFKSSIRSSSAIGQARFFGKPIAYYKQNSLVAHDYKKLTDEIIKKINRRRNR